MQKLFPELYLPLKTSLLCSLFLNVNVTEICFHAYIKIIIIYKNGDCIKLSMDINVKVLPAGYNVSTPYRKILSDFRNIHLKQMVCKTANHLIQIYYCKT